MAPIRTCIIDDEFRSRRRIADLLAAEKEYVVVGEADNGPDAVELIERERPDLVFLDIRMPGLSGFQVLQRVSHRPAVIFVTAYDEHAVQAFEVHAVDYLLKPFPDDRFRAALARIKPGMSDDASTPPVNLAAGSVGAALLTELQRMMESGNPSEHAGTVDHGISSQASSKLERIPVRRGFEFEMVPVAGVDYFTVADGLTFLVQGERRVVVDHTLTDLENRLDPRMFMRVHRNTLVNLNRIERVVPWGRGRIALHFCGQNAEPVHVGRDRTHSVKARLGIG